MPVECVVVVVTYNSADVVGPLLDSLPAALQGTTAEVVVVDNGSRDGTADLVARRGDCTVVRQQNLGYSAGVNAGARAVPDASSILVLNPDARLRPGAVPTMLELLRRAGAGAVAPRVVDGEGRLFHSLRRAPTLLRASGLGFVGHPAVSEYVREPDAYLSEHPVDWALGAVLLVDRRCYDALGGWDESYFLYSEETDFCLRAADCGWPTWFTPHAEVLHIGGASGQDERTHSMQVVNRVRLYARRHGAAAAVAYQLLTVLSELTWVARGHPQSRASVRALVDRTARPAELGCGHGLLPR